MEIALDLIRLASVGLVSAVFASFIANRNFRAQRWWERRADAYTLVIEALSDMFDYYSRLCEAEMEHRKLPDSEEADLEVQWRSGRNQVRRAAALGAFLFSEPVEQALSELQEFQGKRQESYWDHLDENYAAVKKCLDAVVEQSRRDLSIPKALRVFGGW